MLLSPGTEAPEIDSPLLASLPAKLLLPKTWHRHPGTGPLPPSSWVPIWPFSSSLRWTRALKFLGRASDLAFLSGNWDWSRWRLAVGRCGHHPTPMLLEHSAFCLGSSKKLFFKNSQIGFVFKSLWPSPAHNFCFVTSEMTMTKKHYFKHF